MVTRKPGMGGLSGEGTPEGRNRLKEELEQKAKQSAAQHAASKEEDVPFGQDPLSAQDIQEQPTVAMENEEEIIQDPLTLSDDEKIEQAYQAQIDALLKRKCDQYDLNFDMMKTIKTADDFLGMQPNDIAKALNIAPLKDLSPQSIQEFDHQVGLKLKDLAYDDEYKPLRNIAFRAAFILFNSEGNKDNNYWAQNKLTSVQEVRQKSSTTSQISPATPAPKMSANNPQIEHQRQHGTKIATNPHAGPRFPPLGQAFVFHWVPVPGVLINPQNGKPDFSRQCTIWTQQAAPVAPTQAGMAQRFDFPYTNNPVFSTNDGQQQRVFTAQSPTSYAEIDNMIWVAKAKGLASVTLASPKEQGAIQDPNLRAYAMKRLAEENMRGSDPFYTHTQQQQQARGPVANP